MEDFSRTGYFFLFNQYNYGESVMFYNTNLTI